MGVNNVPLGMSEMREDDSHVTMYALDHNGVWLPALTVKIDLEQINHSNWERPLKLAVKGGNYPAAR
jgi:hypothetical protein